MTRTRKALMCTLLPATAACIQLEPAAPTAHQAAATREAEDTRPLKPAAKELDQAQASLDQKEWDSAISHAEKARKTLDAYAGRGYGSTEERKQHNQIRAEATLVGGLAYRGKNDPVGAFLFIDDEGFSAETCGEARREACKEHEALMYKSDGLRGLSTNWAGQSRTLKEFFDVSVGNTALSTTTFEMMRNFWYAKSDYLAIWVTAGPENKYKSAVNGPRASYSIVGSAHSITSKDCSRKVGEVEIGSRRFDVKECHDGTSNYTGATLNLSLPLQDGVAVDLSKEEALVIFRRKDLRQQGVVYNMGEVRLVRTRSRK